jgi:hypothetical protein
MTDINEDNICRKKEKKFSKHFDILINDKKVKILNYQIKDYKTTSEKGRIIEFISQLKFDKADQGEVNIQIVTDKEKTNIKGVWKFSWNGPGNHGIAYLNKELDNERSK